MMTKFAIVFLTKALVILPIVLGTRFHGYNSYKEHYNNRVNDGRLKPRTTASYEMMTIEKSYYDTNKGNSKHTKDSFGSSNVWQPRNGGDNYADVPHCKHMKQTFCEDVPNYPQDFVNRMLAMNFSLLHHAFQDVVELVPRIDNFEEELCLSRKQLILPRTALNRKDEWMYILQSEEPKFRQRVRIEICRELDTKCKLIDGFAEGYVTACKEKYIYRELLAISKNDEIVVRDQFRFPASCCCHVQFRPSR